MHTSLISSLAFLSAAGLCVAAEAPAPSLESGSYEITYRLELPHVERWAINKTTMICLSGSQGSVAPALPVLSDNNPFGECTAVNVRRHGPSLDYDIRCPGRGAAKAHATYTVSSADFKGRVDMVMGAKNMTMTEVQAGHRVGNCDLAQSLRY